MFCSFVYCALLWLVMFRLRFRCLLVVCRFVLLFTVGFVVGYCGVLVVWRFVGGFSCCGCWWLLVAVVGLCYCLA